MCKKVHIYFLFFLYYVRKVHYEIHMGVETVSFNAEHYVVRMVTLSCFKMSVNNTNIQTFKIL
jgi:hypothetical protein